MKSIYLVLLALAIPVGATTVYNNLSEAGSSVDAIEGNQYWGNEFETPSGSILMLSDVILDLEKGTSAGTLTASLYSSTGSGGTSAPGSLIDTINSVSESSLTTSAEQVTFTPTSTITLQPSTLYWIVLQGSSTSAANAEWVLSTNDSGTGGISSLYHDRSNGTTWNVIQSNSAYSNQIPVMEVDAQTPAPEPATFGLLGLSLAGLVLIRKRRA